jgi:glycosyltransferase involved in cell wall biosynthesis
MSGRGRVCLYAPYAWPLFTQGRVPFTGGAEVQQVALARGLAARGFAMSMVCCDYGQPARVEVDGLTILRAFPPHGGAPGVRFFSRLASAVSALGTAAADIYYVRGATREAVVAHEVARRRGAAFVLGAAHDHDARRSLPLIGRAPDRWWIRRAVRGARAVVAQTDFQRALFASEFGVASEVIPNLVELPERPVDAGQEGAVVWLATYKKEKRPEWFVELARRLPWQRFVMCGVVPSPPESLAAYEATRRAAGALANLELRGYLDHARLGELFVGAALMVHTSPVEGFPNTVLEAWAHGIPTVSAVDPDGIVSREALGAVATDVEGMVDAVERIMEDAAARRAAGARALAWVATHHGPGRVLDRMAALLDSVLRP